MKLKLAVIGSRDFSPRSQVTEWMTAFLTQHPDTIVISGGARGVDSWAVEAAEAFGVGTLVFPAEWSRYGRSAGFKRNHAIIGACDRVVAFWDGISRGTAHSIELAKEQNKSIEIIKPLITQLEMLKNA